MRGAYSSKIDDVQPLTKDSFTLVPFALTLFRFPSVSPRDPRLCSNYRKILEMPQWTMYFEPGRGVSMQRGKWAQACTWSCLNSL